MKKAMVIIVMIGAYSCKPERYKPTSTQYQLDSIGEVIECLQGTKEQYKQLSDEATRRNTENKRQFNKVEKQKDYYINPILKQ